MTPEFSRKLAVERVSPEGQEESIEASEEERGALARRFGLPSIHSLRARFDVRPWQRGGLVLKATVEADIEQTCVVTLEPFPVRIEEQGDRYFLAENAPGRHPAVLSLESLEDEEPETIEGGTIDLGEIAAEMLGLSLDPYPRKPGVAFEGSEPGSGDPTGPFSALQGLKKR